MRNVLGGLGDTAPSLTKRLIAYRADANAVQDPETDPPQEIMELPTPPPEKHISVKQKNSPKAIKSNVIVDVG